MQTTKVTLKTLLPLTCSRAGTCCFGNVVMLNPWELQRLSKEKQMTSQEFRDLYTEFGGIKLLFNGSQNNKGQHSCSQYDDNMGCSLHKARPLACRLFPLGRQIQSGKAQYMHQGLEFPCLNECPEVVNLPKLTVGEYLIGQEVDLFEQAQDEYLEVMQNLADIAFELLLDSGLAASGDISTLAQWRATALQTHEESAQRIGAKWLELLMTPPLPAEMNSPLAYAQKHNELLLAAVQEKFGGLETLIEYQKASVFMFTLALHLARGLGVAIVEMAEHWIEIAKSHGAHE